MAGRRLSWGARVALALLLLGPAVAVAGLLVGARREPLARLREWWCWESYERSWRQPLGRLLSRLRRPECWLRGGHSRGATLLTDRKLVSCRRCDASWTEYWTR